MAKTITKKDTINSVVVETSGEAIGNAQLVIADAASSVSVFTGATKAAEGTIAKTTISGGASNAALREVAVGATFAPGEGSLNASGVNQFSNDIIVDALGNKVADVKWTVDKKGKIVAPKLAKGQKFASSIVINSDNEIVLSNVSVSKNVYGGAVARDIKGNTLKKYDANVSAIVNGDSTISLTNVKTSKVFAGGAGYGSVLNGNVDVNYFGGSIGTIYGGGDEGSVVNGDINITVMGQTKGKISKIYAGGKNSTVNGDVTVTFGPNGANYDNFVYYADDEHVFTGTVYGNGEGRRSIVTGSTDLVFNNYSGNFKGSIKNFDSVTISGQANVVFTKGQDRSMKGARYVFVINDQTLGLQSPMLTWNSKVAFSAITVSVETKQAFDVTLISSNKLTKATDFNVNSMLVVNEDGERIYKDAYTLNYTAYNSKTKEGGTVSISYIGTILSFDKVITDKIVLSGADDEINLSKGADLKAGIDLAGGDDEINLGEGTKITGNIDLGSGKNVLTVQKDASVTGTIILDADSTNTIKVNGGAISAVNAADGSNNTFILNGTLQGGGVGYWYTKQVNGMPQNLFVTGNLDLRGSASNNTIYLNQYAAVNSMYLGSGNDFVELSAGSYFGTSFVTIGDGVPVPVAANAAVLDLGSGKNTVVLKSDAFSGNAVIKADKGSKNTIVVADNITLNGTNILTGSTDNVFVLANGIEATYTGSSIGAFIDGTKFSGIYLGQNSILSVGDTKIIENYAGVLNDAASNIMIKAVTDPAKIPANVQDYYSKDTNGVEDSKILGAAITVRNGALVSNSTLSAIGDVSVELGAIVADTEISGVNVVLSGTVSGLSTVAATNVEIKSVDAKPVSIKAEALSIMTSADYTNAELAIDVATFTSAEDITVTMKSAEIGNYALGRNAKLIVTDDNALYIQAADEAQDFSAFAGKYDIAIIGQLKADMTFNGNTIVIDVNGASAITGNISGTANDLVIAEDKHTFLDFGQFASADFFKSITINANSFFVFDGVISADQQKALFEMVTLNGDNAVFGLGTWTMIGSQNQVYTIGNNPGIPVTDLPVLDFDNLYVKSNSVLNGGIAGNERGNEIVLGNDVTVNGTRSNYDYASIATGAGDDILTVNSGSVINGKIAMDDGADTLNLDGVTLNHAVNQEQGAASVAGVIEMGAGDDTINLSGTNAINGSVNFVEGTKTINLTGGATVVNGTINFNAASNNVINVENGKLTVDDIVFGERAASNTINVNGTGATLALTKGAGFLLQATGDNTLNVDGGVFDMNGNLVELDSMADNTLAIRNNGTITNLGSVVLGGGMDDRTNPTTFLSADNNTLVVENATVTLDTVNMRASVKNEIDVVGAAASATLGNIEMYNALTPSSQTYTAATRNVIKADGTLVAKDLMMVGVDENSIDSKLSATFEDVTMSGATTPEEIRNAGQNTITTAGAFNAASVTMLGSKNDIRATSGTFNVAGDVTMADNATIDADGKITYLAATAVNTVELAWNDIVYANSGVKFVQDVPAVSASFTAANLNMIGKTNTIASGLSATLLANNAITFGDIAGTMTVTALAMNAKGSGSTNAVNFGATVSANGVVTPGDPGIHAWTTANVGLVSMTLTASAGIVMTAETSNALNLGYTLSAINEGEITAKGGSITVNSDLTMVSATNNLNLAIDLNAGVQSKITMTGDIAIAVTGNITMESTTANNLKIGYFAAEDQSRDKAQWGVIDNKFNSTVTVTGNIVMKGADTTNTLDIGTNVTFNGFITMGTTDADAVSKTNNLNLTISSATVAIQGITLAAKTNNVNLNGKGTVALGASINGGENNLNLGKDVVVSGGISFGGIVDADKFGDEGYVQVANTANTVNVFGETGVLDTSASGSSNDTIRVIGGMTGAIATGGSTVGDNVLIGTFMKIDNGNLVGADSLFNGPVTEAQFAQLDDAQMGLVQGDVTMGAAKSVGSNVLKVAASFVKVTLDDGTVVEQEFNAEIAGNVTQTTSGSGTNTIEVTGAKRTLPVHSGVQIIALAEINGNIAQVSDKTNTVTLNLGVVDGSVSQVGLTNSLTAEYGAVEGNVSQIGQVNTVSADGSALEWGSEFGGSVTMEAASVAGKQGNPNTTNSANTLTVNGTDGKEANDATATTTDVYGTSMDDASILGAVKMTSANGSNTATFNKTLIGGAIDMTASIIGADEAAAKFITAATTASNTLELNGAALVMKKTWNPVTSQSENTDTQIIRATAASVSMTAATDNTFETELADIAGAVSMTAGGENELTGSKVTVGTTIDMTAGTVNTLALTDFTVGGAITMSAGKGNTAEFGSTLADSSVTGNLMMTSTTDANTLTLNGTRIAAPATGSDIGDVDVAYRTKITGDVTMTAATTNTVHFGTKAEAGNAIGVATIKGALTMNAATANTLNILSGPVKRYDNNHVEVANPDMSANVGSVSMNSKTNTIASKSGAFNVTAGINMTNTDAANAVYGESANTLTVSDASVMTVGGNITAGSVSLEAAKAADGKYTDFQVVVAPDGKETYVYNWGAGDPGKEKQLLTETNTLTVKGKLYVSGKIELVGETNTISLVGNAKQDPNAPGAFDGDKNTSPSPFDPTARFVAKDITLSGKTNSLTVGSDAMTEAGKPKAAFVADTISMGDIDTTVGGKEFKIPAESNSLKVWKNESLDLVGLTMKATTTNTVEAQDFVNIASDVKLASTKVARGFLATGGTIAKKMFDFTNTLGNVSMTVTSLKTVKQGDKYISVVIDNAANTMTVGQNTVAGTVAMAGLMNNLTLNGKTEVIYNVVTEGGVALNEFGLTSAENDALPQGDPQKQAVFTQATEAVITQAAGTVGNITLTIGDALKTVLAAGGATAAAKLVNKISLGAGAVVGNIVSNDSYVYGANVTAGSNDTITINGADVSLNNVDFGFGTDVLDLKGNVLTVNGDITYSGTLTVKNGTINFGAGFGFIGDADNLYFDEMTVYGNIDTNVKTLSALTVGNGTLSAKVTYEPLVPAAGTLNVQVQKDAEGAGNTYTIAAAGSVNFLDSATQFVAKAGTPSAITAFADKIVVKEAANLVVNGDIAFGAGDNLVSMEGNSVLTLNKEWTSKVAFLREGTTDAVNAAGQTLTEWLAADPGHTAANFAAFVQLGTVGIVLEASKLTDAVYTIGGSAVVVANITVANVASVGAPVYTLNLNTNLNGTVTLGANNDTLNLTSNVSGAIDMGAGSADIVNVSANAKFLSLTGAETLNVNGAFTVNAPAAAPAAAYNTLSSSTAIVVNAGGALTIGTDSNIASIKMTGGSLTGTTASDVTVTGAASISTATLTGTVTVSADLTLNAATMPIIFTQALDAKGVAVNTTIKVAATGTVKFGSVVLALPDTTNKELNVTVTGNVEAQSVVVNGTGAITFANDLAINGSFTLQAGASLTVLGKTSGTSFALTNAGTATFGALDYTGTVTVNSGTLNAASLKATGAVVGKIAITGDVTGTNLAGVIAGSTAAKVIFTGAGANFNSKNLVANEYNLAGTTGAVTDTNADIDTAAELKTAMLKMSLGTLTVKGLYFNLATTAIGLNDLSSGGAVAGSTIAFKDTTFTYSATDSAFLNADKKLTFSMGTLAVAAK